jgi:hypothetical protein
VKRCGEVWKGMAEELYVEEGRKMAAIDEQGGRKHVELGIAALAKDGSQIVRNDFSGKFKVIVDVGPSSTSRKDATVRSLVGMAQMTQDQELESVLTSLALMNMDGEGIDDAQKWIRGRLVGMGVVQPTDEEKAELKQQAAQQQPDPGAQLIEAKVETERATALQKAADAGLKHAQAVTLGGPSEAPKVPDGLEAAHKAAQIGKTLADTDHVRVQTEHLPQQLAIEATNAQTNRIKAARAPHSAK